MKAPRTLTTLRTLIRCGVKTASFNGRGQLTAVEFFPYEFEGDLPPIPGEKQSGTGMQPQSKEQDILRESPKRAMDLVLGSDSLPDLSPDVGEVPVTPKIERR